MSLLQRLTPHRRSPLPLPTTPLTAALASARPLLILGTPLQQTHVLHLALDELHTRTIQGAAPSADATVGQLRHHHIGPAQPTAHPAASCTVYPDWDTWAHQVYLPLTGPEGDPTQRPHLLSLSLERSDQVPLLPWVLCTIGLPVVVLGDGRWLDATHSVTAHGELVTHHEVHTCVDLRPHRLLQAGEAFVQTAEQPGKTTWQVP